MKTEISIFVRSQFVAWHSWQDAPKEVSYLRNLHRHVFHVTVEKRVEHGNRDIEFCKFKQNLDEIISSRYMYKELPNVSCEQIADVLMFYMQADRVIVSEDGENGAIVRRIK